MWLYVSIYEVKSFTQDMLSLENDYEVLFLLFKLLPYDPHNLYMLC